MEPVSALRWLAGTPFVVGRALLAGLLRGWWRVLLPALQALLQGLQLVLPRRVSAESPDFHKYLFLLMNLWILRVGLSAWPVVLRSSGSR